MIVSLKALVGMTLAGQSPNLPSMTLHPSDINDSVTVVYPGEIRDAPLKVSIILAFEQNYIHDSVAGGLGFSGDTVTSSFTLGDSEINNVRFKVESGEWGDVILGREFFRNARIKWNTMDNSLVVSTGGTESNGGEKLNYESGFFQAIGKQLPLPSISRATLIAPNVQLLGGFRLDKPEESVDFAKPGMLAVGMIRGELQVFNGLEASFGAGSLFGIRHIQGIPGAAFFGSQTVVIDFQNSKLSYDPSPIHRGAYIIGGKLGLYLQVKDGRLLLTGTRRSNLRDYLKANGFVDIFVESIGNTRLDVRDLGDIDKIRKLLSEIEKERFMVLSDGDKSFTLRFNDKERALFSANVVSGEQRASALQ